MTVALQVGRRPHAILFMRLVGGRLAGVVDNARPDVSLGWKGWRGGTEDGALQAAGGPERGQGTEDGALEEAGGPRCGRAPRGAARLQAAGGTRREGELG